ncbi:MAG TPA: two-component regulator propeller domain-containing protein, partial [Pricia sp.]|nr:two-component regulator propeller domain-containing protein [Pricia sp.]
MAFAPIDNGLSNEWVSCITQDSIGFIWIGTQDGLYRYDGYRFEVLRNSPEEPQSPAANWIRDITIDAKNNFWLATYGGGVTKFSPGKMDFMNFSKGGSNAFQGKLVSHIAPAGKNHVVSSWEEGYAIFNVKTNTHTKLGVEAFKSALTSKDETLWLAGSSNTLLSYDIKTSVLKQVYTFEAPIYLLKYIPKIGLLVSLPNKLVLLKEGTVVNEIATDEAFTLITHDQRGNYYMATSSSIVKLDLDRFHIEPIATDLNVPELKITALFADRQGSLWVGTDKGLFKERKYNIAFLQTRIPLHARRIIKHDEVLYIGGDNGLFKVEQDRTICVADTKRVMGLLSEAGQLFASTDDATVYKFIGDSLSTTIPISTKRGQDLIVRALARDQGGRLWVGSWEGLYVFDRNYRLLKFISLTTESGKGEVKITNLHIDAEDNLWITSTFDGIFKIENTSEITLKSVPDKIKTYRKIEGNNTSLTSNIILTLEEDEEGQMWFGTDTGVVKYDRKTDDFSRLRYQGKLFDRKIMTIRKDAARNLWITTINDGLYVYNQVKKTIRHYTEKDGLISNAFLFGSGFFDAVNKIMYFGTDEGVQQIDLSRPFAKNQMNTPVVTDFEVNTANGDAVFSPCVAPFLNDISLAPDQNDFSISFSALDFTNPEKIQYAYALDNDAIKITNYQTAYFTNVPFGSHVLKVQTLYDGVIQNRGISNLSVYIKPPWYLSRFVKFFYFLLSCALVIGIYFYFKWRWSMKLSLKLKEEETERLKKLNDFKSNLYTDIAHEFKTPLTLISGPIDQKLSEGDLSHFDHANFTMVKR